MSTQETPETKTQDNDPPASAQQPAQQPAPAGPAPAKPAPAIAIPVVNMPNLDYVRSANQIKYYTKGKSGIASELIFTYDYGNNNILFENFGGVAIPLDFFNKYPTIFIGRVKVREISVAKFVSLVSRASALVLLDKIDEQFRYVSELYLILYMEASRRVQDKVAYPSGSDNAIDLEHAKEVITSAFNKNASLQPPIATHKTTNPKVVTIAGKKVNVARIKINKLNDAVKKGMELGPPPEPGFDIDTFEEFLDKADEAQKQKELDEIEEALRLLEKAKEDKFLKSADINAQVKGLVDLRNRLKTPEYYTAGGKSFTSGKTFVASKGGSGAFPDEGVYQLNDPKRSIKRNTAVDSLPDRQTSNPIDPTVTEAGQTFSVRVPPPVQRTGPSLEDRTAQPVAGEPVAPQPQRAQPTTTESGRIGSKALELEAREYIRKIGEIPMSLLPANVNDIRIQLDKALNAVPIPNTLTAEQINKNLLIAVTKARSYFSRAQRLKKNFLPDSMETAGRVIDDALEDTKKMEELRKAEEKKKIPLDDLRPDVEQGEERRIRRDFNKDVLQLTEANEVLQSKVEIQREEIKVLKETIETKEQKENNAMLSGIAPVFRNLLYLDLENVVKEEEAQEQVYYTVI